MSYTPMFFAGISLCAIGLLVSVSAMCLEKGRLSRELANSEYLRDYGRIWEENGTRHFSSSAMKTSENDPGPPVNR